MQGREALPGIVPLQQQPLFTGDVQGITGPGDGVEVKALRVVDAVLEWRPALTTILGTQDQVEHTHHIAQFVVGEPDIEQRLVGALLHQLLTFSDQQWPLLIGRLGRGQRAVVFDEQIADLAAVQLFAPGCTGIAAVQHDTIVTDRPTLLGRREKHRSQVAAQRNAGLHPVLARIVGKKNMATLANGDQALARSSNADQGAMHGQRTRHGRQLQHINKTGRPSYTLQQHRTQQRQHELFQGTHTAPSRKATPHSTRGTTRRRSR
ncbi:hypothetical protein D3C76_655640 [compost metagenome]